MLHDDAVAFDGGPHEGDLGLYVDEELVPVVDLLDRAVARDQPLLVLLELGDPLDADLSDLVAEGLLLDSQILLLTFRHARRGGPGDAACVCSVRLDRDIVLVVGIL